MIVEKINKELEVDNFGFEDTSNRISLDADVIGEVFDILSTQMYKDPFGSIVREIGSNSDDSHVEAGVEKPIIVECKYEEGDYYLCFVDEGMGISPSRWKDSFAKYLKSTKTKDNNQIGGFGLGSKSPFSYTDLYYVTTIYDGIEYEYTMEKDDEGYPKEGCLCTRETTKHNGTTLKFLIEGGIYSQDYYKFHEAIVEQLMYFHSVYYKGLGINNNFKIYEGKTFKYRLDTSIKEMHIVLGKVKYPIEWKRIGMEPINIPVGVIIPIGSVDLIKSRESLRYTDRSKEVVKKAIDDTLNELKQYATGECHTIEEYFAKLKNQGRSNETITLRVKEGVDIPVRPGDYGFDKQGNTITFPFKTPTPYYKPFENTPIKIPSDNPFFPFKVKHTLAKGRIAIKEKNEETNLWKLLHPEEDGRRTNMSIPTLYRTNKFVSDKYKNFALQEGLIITKKKLSYREIMSSIGLGQSNVSGYVRFLQKRQEEDAPLFIGPLEGLRETRGKTGLNIINKIRPVPIIGEWGNKLSLAKLYIKEITKAIVAVSESYDKYDVSAYQMQEYEELMRSRRVVLTRNKESVYATDIYEGVSSPKIEYKYETLTKGTGFIIYGDNSFKDQLATIKLLLDSKSNRVKYIKGDLVFFPFRILMINKSDVKRMEEFENAYNIQEFMLGQNSHDKADKDNHYINNVFREEATKVIAHPILKQVDISPLVFKLCTPIDKLGEEMNKYSIAPYEYDKFKNSKLGKEMLFLIEQNEWYNKDVVNNAKALLEISKNLSIFNSIKPRHERQEFTLDDERLFASILIKAGYMPDLLYTLVLTDEEIKWMDEWEALAKYYTTIESRSCTNYKITKIVNEKAWKSYPKSRMPSKSAKISMLLLGKRSSQ